MDMFNIWSIQPYWTYVIFKYYVLWNDFFGLTKKKYWKVPWKEAFVVEGCIVCVQIIILFYKTCECFNYTRYTVHNSLNERRTILHKFWHLPRRKTFRKRFWQVLRGRRKIRWGGCEAVFVLCFVFVFRLRTSKDCWREMRELGEEAVSQYVSLFWICIFVHFVIPLKIFERFWREMRDSGEEAVGGLGSRGLTCLLLQSTSVFHVKYDRS